MQIASQSKLLRCVVKGVGTELGIIYSVVSLLNTVGVNGVKETETWQEIRNSYRSFDTTLSEPNFFIFQEKLLKVLKCYNFL
jgi:hypothetical protein